MHPLRIGLDFDGVIVDHHPNKLRLAREAGFALEPWQLNSNLMGKFMPREPYDRLREALYGELTLAAPPVAGAMEFLSRLPGEIHIISARDDETLPFARAWLERHGLHDVVAPERIVFCGSSEDKPGHCARFGLDIFLDDQLKVLRLLPRSLRRVLFDIDRIASRLPLEDGISVSNGWNDFHRLASDALVGAG